MHTCFVFGCGKVASAREGRSLHSIPKHDTGAWKEFLERTNEGFKIPDQPKICVEHFHPDCISTGGLSRRSILKGHVPTLLNGRPLENWECVQFMKKRASVVNLELMDIDVCQNVEIVPAKKFKCDNINEEDNEVDLFEEHTDTHYWRERALIAEDSNVKLQDKVSMLESELKAIKNKGTVKTRSHATQTPSKTVNMTQTQELFYELEKRQLCKGAYSKPIEDFSVKLHYLSPRGYNFVRSFFNDCLPNPKTFSRWVSSIDTQPGILPSSLKFLLDSNSKEKKLYNLIIDEVHLRKKLTHVGTEIYGYCNYGGLVTRIEDKTQLAKSALFIMANEIDGSKAVPLGYLLCDKLDSEMISEILRTSLIQMSNVGATVISVTFDGLPANKTAAEKLGANLNVDSLAFKTDFPHPVTKAPVFINFDSSHMYKLLRNQLEDCGVFFDENDKEIKWAFVEKLVQLQNQEGVRLANKLTTRHSIFKNQKMKTRLATQTLSNSTAVAMTVCEKLGLDDFKGASDTAKFFKLMDRVFDMTNSRVGQSGFKAPLRAENYDFWSAAFDECIRVLRSLRYYDPKKDKKVRLVESIKGTFARGLIITLASIRGIMRHYVMNLKILKYLCTYKLSQDFIEMFFAKIRSRLGNNNNPCPYQLLHLLKYVLSVSFNVSAKANCTPQDDTDVTVATFSKSAYSNLSSAQAPTDWIDVEYLSSMSSMSLFLTNAVVYISGYVCKDLCGKLQCSNCVMGLLPVSEDEIDIEHALIFEKNNGGLCIPSKAVVSICKMTETCIRVQRQEKGVGSLNTQRIIQQVTRDSIEAGIFKGLTHEGTSREEEVSHVFNLIQEISRTYCKIKFHYIAKEETLKVLPTTNRSINTKVTHFTGN